MDANVAAKPSLVIKRRFKALPAKIFAAWTDPAQIMRWFGPEGATEVKAEADARVGGRYRVTFRTPDGQMNDASGVYREVVAGRKLVFSWMWRTLPERVSEVTVDLVRDGDGTLMTFTQAQLFDEAVVENHRGGWTGAFDKLETLVG